MLEALRLANELLAPVMPSVHAKICQCLTQEPAQVWSGRLEWGSRLAGVDLGPKMILFPRD
jgi:methionyl-tRNA synthetase